jgi:hypothetical protein
MLDCRAPLDATPAALAIEDGGYHASFADSHQAGGQDTA